MEQIVSVAMVSLAQAAKRYLQTSKKKKQGCLVTPDCLGMGKKHVLQQKNRINKLNMGEVLFLFPLETWKLMGLSGPLDEISLLWIA